MSESAPILYSFRRCPYAMRARMALWVSGQACELREVKLANKPPELLALSEKATVPVLQLAGGKVLEESLDIMRWALGQSDPEGWLGGGNAELIAHNDGAFKHALDRYKYPTRYPDEADGDDAAFRLHHRNKGAAILNELNDRLAGDKQLSGNHRSFADIALFPFIRQFANTDRAWFDAQDWPHLQRWLDGHLGSSLFANVMAKYNVWKSGDAVTMFGQMHRF